MQEPTDEDGTEELVGMGLRVSFSPAQITFYVLLVLLGIFGNATVVAVIGKNIVRDRGAGNNSDIIIMNMALSNLLVSLMRNTLLVISDIGLEVGGLYSPHTAVLELDRLTVTREKLANCRFPKVSKSSSEKKILPEKIFNNHRVFFSCPVRPKMTSRSESESLYSG